ncbi:hypothetical protein swp_3147 [Shewanella piezotolerans WP3]|uniref:Uncharacterized protein n=1 Tax=Shewanella piezotolerans (strain WP3 / JCM 13877) TaxID=225849 RepID=B8CPZ4_SHEPW|nr:hypothetical protein swp_3147 [Shewanella piezotolerans WP3]
MLSFSTGFEFDDCCFLAFSHSTNVTNHKMARIALTQGQ